MKKAPLGKGRWITVNGFLPGVAFLFVPEKEAKRWRFFRRFLAAKSDNPTAASRFPDRLPSAKKLHPNGRLPLPFNHAPYNSTPARSAAA